MRSCICIAECSSLWDAFSSISSCLTDSRSRSFSASATSASCRNGAIFSESIRRMEFLLERDFVVEQYGYGFARPYLLQQSEDWPADREGDLREEIAPPLPAVLARFVHR